MTPTPGLGFRVLGPLAVTAGTDDIPLTGRMPRILLATLLLHPNRIVYIDTLIETLWPHDPPASAIINLRTYVSRLRGLLNTHDDAPRLITRTGGYQLNVATTELDLLHFEHLATTAQQHWHNGDTTAAINAINTATALWHGEFLEDLPPNIAWTPTTERLTAQRNTLTELATRIKIQTGQYDAAIADLRHLTTTDPLHEGWWHSLVLALHATGQTALALHAYADARRILIDELGIEPGPKLRGALETVLGRDNTAGICQLPIDAHDFTGRTELLADLTTRLTGTSTHPTIIAISGPPGVGKTALAVRAAYTSAEAFPDGQLYIELQGTTGEPRDPATTITETLNTLGIPETDIPKALPAKTALYRSHLARRRMLILLDDAAGTTQIAPLLLGAGNSAIIITSRTRLTDLPSTHHVNINGLSTNEATNLFTRLTKDHPATGSTTAILHACGHLPLAIKIAAAKLAHHPEWTPDHLVRRLSQERQRLDHLRLGDLDTRASIALSYRLLPEAAARAFRRLSLLGPASLPAWTVTALAGAGHGEPDPLETLINANLIHLVGADPIGQPRVQLHDLLRCFALERAEEESPGQRAVALCRLLDTWLALATRAAEKMPVAYFGVALTEPAPLIDIPFIADHATTDPVAWFDTARQHLLSAIELAYANGFDDHAWRLAATLAPYCDLRGRFDDWLTSHQAALRAARRVGNVRGEAILTRNIGQLCLYQDQYTEATEAFERAHAAFETIGDTNGQAVTLCGQGAVHRMAGRLGDAISAQRRALRLFHQENDRSGEALVRIGIGRICLSRNRPNSARHWFTTAHALAVALGDRHRQAQAVHQLARIHTEEGDLDFARQLLDESLSTLESLGDEHCTAYVRQSIGELHLRSGDVATGRALLTDSLQVQQRLGDRSAAETITALLQQPHE